LWFHTSWAGGALGWLLEQQRLAIDAALEPDPPRQRVQEVEIGLVPLQDVVDGPAGVVDVGGQAGIARDLRRDVRVLHVLVGHRLATGREAVRAVVAAHDGPRAQRVVVRLDRRDLAVDEWLRGIGRERCGGHHDPGADLDPGA
jgi:hypothetical protein